METPLLFNDVAHPTWLLYVSLLVLAVFFRFSRLLSVRNLDVVLLLFLSIALVTAASSQAGREADGVTEASYHWSDLTLLGLSVLLIVRLLFDESLTRRPRLEQNLNQAGLTFLCVPAFAILMTSVFVTDPPNGNVAMVESGKALLQRQAIGESDRPGEEETPAPTETIIAAIHTGVAELSGGIATDAVSADAQRSVMENTIAQLIVVLAHATVVVGLLYIGQRHFNSLQLGVSMSCLYLLLPCTAFMVHELSHVLPAACLTWAFACYRKPMVAGVLLGLACGTLFFAVFLLPLWAVFYGRRGSLRFGISLGAVAAVVLITVAFTSSDANSFMNRLVQAANWTVYRLFSQSVADSSNGIGQIFLRITLGSVFFLMLIGMTAIPRRRNLENLLADSTALIVTAQLWYPEDVGIYVLWYLPLLLLVIFRPRLDRFTPPVIDDAVSAIRARPVAAQGGTGATTSRVTLYH